jgi:hypothetical protein
MLDVLYPHREGGFYRDLLWIPLAHGGWAEAKRQLSKVGYAKLRKKRGDCMTKDFLRAGVPRWYRRDFEKELRHHNTRELHRYMRNPDYEVMAHANPSTDAGWYWY